MTSSTNYSEINVRPRRSRGVRASNKSILYSDYNDDAESNNINQRSISLTALPVSTVLPIPSSTGTGPPLEPRMAQLETLEAKMASIEVSLSTTPRRKAVKKNGAGTVLSGKPSSTVSVSSMSMVSPVKSNLADSCRELQLLKNVLMDKENTIQNLQGHMNCCGRLVAIQPLDPAERRAAELRLQHLKQEEEVRKSAIKKIDMSLEQMDTTEGNIDVRIRQAELEYELGREELGLLGVREEVRTLQARLDAKPAPTLYSCVNGCSRYLLHCVQFEYDAKSPRFGAGNTEDKVGLYVLWATEDSGFQKGDRILEVNGKLTLATTKEEMLRLLTVCPSRAEVVVCRLWTPPPSTEDLLRRENLRLTHRISYLEDQVAEVITQRENSQRAVGNKPVEVFQKGSQVTLFSKPEVAKNIKHSTTVAITSKMSGDEVASWHKYQEGHEGDSYQSFQPKIQNSGDKIKALSKKYEKDEFSSTLSRKTEEEEERRVRRNFLNTKNSEKSTYSLSDLERSTRKWNPQYYTKVVDYNSETSCPRFKTRGDRSVKSLDLDADQKIVNSDQHNDLNKQAHPPSRNLVRVVPRAASLHNVEVGYSLHNAVRKLKRSHKGEAPQPPVFKTNGCYEYANGETKQTSPSESGQSSYRWTGHYHRNRTKSSGDEKWC